MEMPVGEDDIAVVPVRYLQEGILPIGRCDQEEPFLFIGELTRQRLLITGQVVLFGVMIPTAFVIKSLPLFRRASRDLQPDFSCLVIVYGVENREGILDVEQKGERLFI